MTNLTVKIPDGYMQDAQGKLVPEDLVKDIDKKRDKLVIKLVADAKIESERLSGFKKYAMDQIEEFIVLSGKQFQTKMGGNKGNVTLMSYDGRYKVQRAISEHLVFDERLQVAKKLIDECITEWTSESRSEIRALIDNAFQVDKEGKISTSRILGLKRLNIVDRKWKKAMQAINDSIQVAGSKAYVRIYERIGDTDRYQPISLDVASS